MVTVGVQLICDGTVGRRQFKRKVRHSREESILRKQKTETSVGKPRRKSNSSNSWERGKSSSTVNGNFTLNFRVYCNSLMILKRQYHYDQRHCLRFKSIIQAIIWERLGIIQYLMPGWDNSVFLPRYATCTTKSELWQVIVKTDLVKGNRAMGLVFLPNLPTVASHLPSETYYEWLGEENQNQGSLET